MWCLYRPLLVVTPIKSTLSSILQLLGLQYYDYICLPLNTEFDFCCTWQVLGVLIDMSRKLLLSCQVELTRHQLSSAQLVQLGSS